jgi:hypothetical protein
VDNDSNASQPAREKWELARRDFLIMGSMAVAGVAASTASAGTISALATRTPGSILSVGFAERTGPGASLVSAESVRGGDRRFVDSGVRVTLHGISQPEATRNTAIRLSLFYPHMTSEGRLPFLAFASSIDGRGGRNTASRLSFDAPLDDTGSLPVGIERVDVSPIPRRLRSMLPRATAQLAGMDGLEQDGNLWRLSSGNAGNAQLRPGTYYIALRQSNRDRLPNWGALAVGDNALDLRSGGRPVDFEFVALSVDYTKA